MEYGEEDLDWTVVPIPGKGLGVVALRDIPPKYRYTSLEVPNCQYVWVTLYLYTGKGNKIFSFEIIGRTKHDLYAERSNGPRLKA